MSKSASPQRDEVVKVRVPFSIRKRGGRKLIVVPAGAEALPQRPRVDCCRTEAACDRPPSSPYTTAGETSPELESMVLTPRQHTLTLVKNGTT
jgi:hypothetical protein